MTTDNLRIAADANAAALECARFIARHLDEALAKQSVATLAISGGKTPTPMFQDLAKSGIDWSRVHLFWVDERCVPPTDDRSNFKIANANLVEPAGIPQGNVHRIKGELPPDEAAAQYIEEIKNTFGLKGADLPVFDILHRGMGDDAHTASLFPGEPLIKDRAGIAAHVWVEKMKMDRITLLPGVLLAARTTVLQVSGTDKAEPLWQVLYGPEDPTAYPCQLATRSSDHAVWFLDEAAAAKVQGR